VIDVEMTDHDLTVDGRWTYAWSASRRPFIHPLCTPSGLVLTREAPDDHPWHHGLWFTIKFVNGENFWEEYDEYGVLRHDGPPEVDHVVGVIAGDAVVVDGTLRWVRPDRTTVVIDENRRFTHRRLGGDAYAIDVEVVLTPRVDVVLDRTPFTTWGGYGGLTLRGNDAWTDTRLLLADGSAHQQIHGIRSRWCDLSSAEGGVTIVDHPDNPRFPTPWYGSTKADTYGDGWANFFNAAFLWNEPLSVEAGDVLELRHRVVVHDGEWDVDRIESAATEFASS
jgi:hypothetical protein